MSPARKRNLGIVAALAVVVAGVAIALAVSGDDDSGKDKTTAARETSTQPPAERTTSEPIATTKAPPSKRLQKRRRDRSEVGVQTAVTKLVTSAEQGDGRAFCTVLGRPTSGSGMSALQTCASAAGVQTEQLPTSDELSIQRVRLQGETAVVTVTPGTRFLLRRSGDRWNVATVKTAAP
jgi:hypothetical protein